MKNFLIVLLVIGTIVFFASCDSSGDGSVTTADLAGIWIAVGEDEGVGKAMLFEFSGNNFTRIAYSETFYDEVEETEDDMVQDEGTKGTFTISDDTFTITITKVWNENTYQWDDVSDIRNIPFSLSGNTLTMTIDEMTIPFTKKSFLQPENLIDAWYETTGVEEMVLGSDGAYSYASEGTFTGTWSATVDMFRTITTSDGAAEFYLENLYYYDFTDPNLVFSWDGTEMYNFTNAPG